MCVSPWMHISTFFSFLAGVAELLWVDIDGARVAVFCHVLIALNKAPSWKCVPSCWDRLFPLGLLQQGERTAEPWKWQDMARVSATAGPWLQPQPCGKSHTPRWRGSFSFPTLTAGLAHSVSLLCIRGFREQNLNYDVTVTILASNIVSLMFRWFFRSINHTEFGFGHLDQFEGYLTLSLASANINFKCLSVCHLTREKFFFPISKYYSQPMQMSLWDTFHWKKKKKLK